MTPKLKAEDLLPEPVRPEDWECCGSECGDACIQTIYSNDKRAYDEQQRLWKAQLAEEAAEKGEAV
ncbi:MAG: oxidoreductase-like domain-containing protein [Neisseria sp.]|nr:oxidoreductase-like domain-containing protein [Neisseria sp.]